MALPPVTAVAPWERASATSSLTRSYCGSLLIGPSFTPSSVPSPTLMVAGVGGQALDHVVVERLGDVDALDGRAHLAVVHERAGEDGRRDDGGVGVVEHDGGVVAAELERDALEVGRGRHGHLLPRLDRAGEADLARDGMRGHPGAELVAAAHDVDDAGREDVAQELADLERRQRGERATA